MILNRTTLFYISCLCFFLIIYFQPRQSFAIDFEKEIDKLLSLPEKKIDIGTASLILAKEIYPNLDIKVYSAKIDAMVEGVRIITKGSTNPDYRIRVLNTYLYKIAGIKYDLSDPYAEKLENRYLNGILDTKKGSCVTMPLLYLTIAQRLGYPVYPVGLPWHLILRYADSKLKMQNIEATGGGGYVSDEEYIQVLQISDRSIKSGAYLRTMTYREFLADLVAQNGIYWGMHGDYRKAIIYIEKCVKINPKSADHYKTLGTAYLLYSRRLKWPIAEEYRLKAESFLRKADELGVTRLSNKNYIEEQKKAQEKFRKKQQQKEG